MRRKKRFFYLLIASLMLTPISATRPLIFPRAQAVQSDVKFDKILENMGFKSDRQKLAFKALCKEANIHIDENFSAVKALELVEATQKLFLNRKDKQERWEVSELEWIYKDSNSVKSSLEDLGLFSSKLPEKSEYDALCILGAAGPTMQSRILFAQELIQNGLKAGNIVLLTGERYLTEGVDGSSQDLLNISEYFGVEPKELTETHLFKYLYERSEIKDKANLVVIDTRQKDGRRPTTQTTVEDFLKWRESNSDVKSALFISNQPSVMYQNAVISEVVYYHNDDLIFETVGKEYHGDNLQRTVGELGAYIWAVMPQILRNTDVDLDAQSFELAKKIYSHQPIFLNNIFDSSENISLNLED